MSVVAWQDISAWVRVCDTGAVRAGPAPALDSGSGSAVASALRPRLWCSSRDSGVTTICVTSARHLSCCRHICVTTICVTRPVLIICHVLITSTRLKLRLKVWKYTFWWIVQMCMLVFFKKAREFDVGLIFSLKKHRHIDFSDFQWITWPVLISMRIVSIKCVEKL